MTEGLCLEIVEGPGAGTIVPLSTTLEVGSDPAAGVALADPHVEARHARVSPDGDGALVEDLGEPGGTFVNDAELHAPTRIRPGDEIQVGVTVLQLRSAAQVAEAGSAARPGPPAPAFAATNPDPPEHPHPISPELAELLDPEVKWRARLAPLALFVLVVFVVLVFLALAK